MSYTYLASPYTHQNPMVREFRYLAVRQHLHDMLLRREWAYSPIVHCHPLATMHDLPKDIEFWHDYDMAMIAPCSHLIVLCLPGWESSKGVSAEVAEAEKLEKRISHVFPKVDAYVEVLRKLAA